MRSSVSASVIRRSNPMPIRNQRASFIQTKCTLPLGGTSARTNDAFLSVYTLIHATLLSSTNAMGCTPTTQCVRWTRAQCTEILILIDLALENEIKQTNKHLLWHFKGYLDTFFIAFKLFICSLGSMINCSFLN